MEMLRESIKEPVEVKLCVGGKSWDFCGFAIFKNKVFFASVCYIGTTKETFRSQHNPINHCPLSANASEC